MEAHRKSTINRRTRDQWWLRQLLSGASEVRHQKIMPTTTELWDGIHQFNRGEFRLAHETWESLWRSSEYPIRLFFLSLAKLGAGFIHAARQNSTGATRLLNDSLKFLQPFLPSMMGVDTQRLDIEVRKFLDPIRGTSHHFSGHGNPLPLIHDSTTH